MEQSQDGIPFELKTVGDKKGFAHWGRQELADFDTLLDLLGTKPGPSTPGMELSPHEKAQNTTLLARYGLSPPKNLNEIDLCIETLKLAREAILRTIMNQSLDVETLLDASDIAIIESTTLAFKAGDTVSLLDLFLSPSLMDWQSSDITAWPMTALATLLELPTSQHFGKRLLQDLGWYGTDDDQATSAVTLANLILKALALDLDPESNLRGYDVDQPNNWGRSYDVIRDEIERYFQTSGMVLSDIAALLASRILKQSYPAGLQVEGIPLQLAYRRSSAWLQLQHGINLAEVLEPGSSHKMTYQQLLEYPSRIKTNASDEQTALLSSTLTPPLLQWAQVNDIITRKPESGYTVEHIEQAYSTFGHYENKLEHAIRQLKISAPDRLKMARSQLAERKIPTDTLFIDREGYTDEYIRAHREGFSDSHPLNVIQGRHVIDVLASGRLKGVRSNWMPALVRGHDGDYYPIFMDYMNFPDIPTLFETEFEAWWKATAVAFDTVVNTLLNDLPNEDRLAMEMGHVRLYTLRKSNLGLVQASTSPDVTTMLNTPSNSNPLVAQCGYILHTVYQSKHYYHEVLPYSGLIRRRDDLHRHRDAMDSRQPAELPFDWKAYSTGAPPDFNAKSEVIIHHLNEYRSNDPSAQKGFSARRKTIANDIIRQFEHRNKVNMHKAARGITAFDKPDPVVAFLKTFVIPIWDPLESFIDAVKSRRSFLEIVIAAAGLAMDIVSLVFPVAKVVGLTTRFVKAGVKFGFSAGLPRLGALAKGMAVAANDVLNPLSGAPDILKFVGKLPFRLNNAALNVLTVGIEQSRKLLRLGSHSNVGTLILTGPKANVWKNISPNHNLLKVDGQPDVVVFENGFNSLARPDRYLVDPQTHRPFGPRLMQIDDAGSLTRHVPHEIETGYQEGKWFLFDDTPGLTKHWVRWGDELFLESGGISYKLVSKGEGSVLRRIDALDAGNRLKPFNGACRIPRGLDLRHCPGNSFRNVNHSGLQARTNQGRNVQPWFTDISITASTGTHKEFVHNRFIWRAQNNTYSKVTGHKLGPDQYKASITTEIIGGNDIFKRITVRNGILANINDTREISAVVAKRKDTGVKVIVTRVDDQSYYKGVFTDGQKNITLERMQVDLTHKAPDLSDNDFLAHIYNGSFDANAFIKTLSPEVIAADLRKIKAEIDAGRTPYLNQRIGGPYDMGTTAEEAALFCKYTRSSFEITPRLTSPYWKAISTRTPLPSRTEIASELNRLHLSPNKFTANNILLAQTTRLMSQNNKNLAYLKIKFKDRQAHPDKVYYAISGLKKTDTDVELTKLVDGKRSAEAGWKIDNGVATSPDNVRYINTQRTHMATGSRRDPDEVIFLPDLKSHSQLLPSGNHRMLDTEHMILNRLNRDGIDFAEVDLIHVFSTKPTCPSCTMGLAGLGAKLPENKFEVFEGVN